MQASSQRKKVKAMNISTTTNNKRQKQYTHTCDVLLLHFIDTNNPNHQNRIHKHERCMVVSSSKKSRTKILVHYYPFFVVFVPVNVHVHVHVYPYHLPKY
mmetsp:Transcript_27381/g.30718  ORF Transcript_27381/g.30718 Transcript_27381/m.30718 type:complete len:100 (+) Transcript_27381:57-356(+)